MLFVLCGCLQCPCETYVVICSLLTFIEYTKWEEIIDEGSIGLVNNGVDWVSFKKNLKAGVKISLDDCR